MTLTEKLKELVENGYSIEFYKDEHYVSGASNLYAVELIKDSEHMTRLIYPESFVEEELLEALDCDVSRIEKRLEISSKVRNFTQYTVGGR